MRALKLLLVLFCAALVLFATACSESGDSTPYFQNNVGEQIPHRATAATHLTAFLTSATRPL